MAAERDRGDYRSPGQVGSRCGSLFPGPWFRECAVPARRHRRVVAGGRHEPSALSPLLMNEDLQKKISEAIADPKNIGEMPNADAIGTVGNAECGEMLRMWIKYKQQGDRK